MLTAAFPAAAFGTNCYVLATGRGEECLVVDPGIGIEEQLREVLTELRLKPAAVLLTHGHIDHVYSVTPVCGGQLGAYIHADDRHRLRDPLASLDPALLGMFEQQFGRAATWTEPSDVREISDGTTLDLAGLTLSVQHAPGHTEGSVLFGLDQVPDGVEDQAEVTSTVLSGDVLFAGSIGRTDLPGGDHAAMQRSLRDVVLPLPDPTLVLPGHGPATTMRQERTTNPYLQDL
ncbi:glyoxylase-like metal-dependent hydrolase (beta-lactamase superfamily II) [Barrientosiimonas humi]|uniref:Glyoxylase-like metal-dependent hydrolase (Beta-lactamase superfamily II) n=1 Tax=Barrientosiimonas humi TaxID=999931 RepID=A0A542XBG3_9MICO|nr:MBL fold metallo-hydrolase [Barrientosiimonas humi]TQL33173.1 glyoxylase-like metal-dependent hydrolase (beta-lactamase superfamily II) [Barrientosiimonas humi]CAG7573162.1 putative metallo-hydrolase [Barrientosiimonas humi]